MASTSTRGSALALVLALLVATPLAGAALTAPALAGTALAEDRGGSAAGLHGNHVAVDPQVSSDGTVVVETLSSLTPSFVVLRADDGGRPGDPLGSAFVGETGSQTFYTAIPVQIDESVWGDWTGNRSLWAVLHSDENGNGEFEYGTDRSMARFSPESSTRVTVRKSAEGNARIVAAAFDPQPMPDRSVTVRRAELPSAGHVVVRTLSDGEPVGTRSLAAGGHDNVTVDLNESFVAEQRSRFRVQIVAYRDDGDGAFGPGDSPITAGGEPVGTYLTVEKGDASDDEPLINTPTVTTAPERVGNGTPAATAVPTDDPTAVPTGDRPTDDVSARDTTTGSGAGFGGAVAAAALVIVAAVGALGAASTRRRR